VRGECPANLSQPLRQKSSGVLPHVFWDLARIARIARISASIVFAIARIWGAQQGLLQRFENGQGVREFFFDLHAPVFCGRMLLSKRITPLPRRVLLTFRGFRFSKRPSCGLSCNAHAKWISLDKAERAHRGVRNGSFEELSNSVAAGALGLQERPHPPKPFAPRGFPQRRKVCVVPCLQPPKTPSRV
jgi:hypothetical protein